jgi:hypothetical protein
LASLASVAAAATVNFQSKYTLLKWGGLGLPACCLEDLGLIETESGSAAAFGLPNGLGQMIWMDLRGGSLSDHTSGRGQIFNQIMQVFDRLPSGRPRLTGFATENVNGSSVRVDFSLHRNITLDALRRLQPVHTNQQTSKPRAGPMQFHR